MTGPEDQSSRPRYRILVVDDHELVRSAIVALVSGETNIEVCGEAGSVREAVALAEAHRPDLVLMDLCLPDGTGIEATRRIREILPDLAIIILSSFATEDSLLLALRAGAAGFLSKSTSSSQLLRAIRAAAAGQGCVDPQFVNYLFGQLRGHIPEGDERLARLAPQERRILSLVTEGRTNKQIAAELHLADKTVRNYVSSILAKLEVAGRTDAAVYASRCEGLAEVPSEVTADLIDLTNN